MSNVIAFKKPFKLARREDVNPNIVAEWITQARKWKYNPNATEQQKALAKSILDQWGTE